MESISISIEKLTVYIINYSVGAPSKSILNGAPT
jgi:hypothetical protein